MRLIAKKPCCFGGRKYYIGEEIPLEYVANPKLQKEFGIIDIIKNDNGRIPDEQSGILYTQQQVDEAVRNARIEEAEKYTAALEEIEPEASEKTVQIAIKTGSDGNNDQIMAIPATQAQIQQTFEIMQMNADKASGVIADVKDENVLTMLALVDSRSTVKKAAKNKLDNLSLTEGENNGAGNGNDATEEDKEGEA